MDGAARNAGGWYGLGGAILALCGVASLLTSDLFLDHVTLLVGVGFCLSGLAGVMACKRLHRCHKAGGGLPVALLDGALGVLMIVYPLIFEVADFWVLGIAFVAFGILELIGLLPMAKIMPDLQVIMALASALAAIIGILVLVWPASASVWLAAFAFVRSIILIAMGLTIR